MAQATAGGNCVNSGGVLNSQGYNLESANTCNFTSLTDLHDTDPVLGPLQANGGPTVTHALLAGSPAIDKGSAICLKTDQRGLARPQGIACDIGAYEFMNMTDLAIAASVAPMTITLGTNVTYTLRISNLGPETATLLTLTDELPNGVNLVTATLTGGLCGHGSPLTCTLPTLAAGLNATATIVVAPLHFGPITNTASVSAATPDVNVNNNKIVTVISVLPTRADLTPPGPVANLTVTLLTTQGTTLRWAAATDNVGVVGYRIFAHTDGTNQAPCLAGIAAGTATTYTVTTLTTHTGYQLWVVAYDQAGNVLSLAALAPVHIMTLALPVGVVQISLEPPQPTELDVISIIVSGVHTSSCVPQYQSHQRIGYLIAIQSMPSPEMFCLPAEFPWRYAITVGPLAAGQYTVTHTLGQVVDTTFFTVTAATPGAPVFQVDSRQSQAATVGALFQYALKAIGGSTPTYALLQGPTGMTINPATGQLQWLPTTTSVGDVTVTVRAANTLGSTLYTFQLTVLPGASLRHSFLPLVTHS